MSETTKIDRLVVKDILGIEDLDVALRGNHVYCIGRNGANKTNTINAIFKVLTGNDMPEKMLRLGTEKGEVNIETEFFDIRYYVTEKQPKGVLQVTGKGKYADYDGKKPREWLNERVGTIDISLQEFFSKSDKKKLEFIKEVFGIDYSEIDRRIEGAVERRKLANSQVKVLEGQFAGMPYDAALGDELIDLNELLGQRAALEAETNTYAVSQQHMAKLVKRKEEIRRRREEIQAELTGLQLEEESVDRSTEAGRAWFENNQDPEERMAQVELALSNVHQHNQRIMTNIKAIDKRREADEAIAAAKSADAAVKALEAEKQQLMKEKPFPIPGMEIRGGQLYLNDLPFEPNQINTAEQYIALLQMQLPLMKEVAIARMDFSLLDEENTMRVLQWCWEHEIQMFGELVDRQGGPLRIEIVQA